MVSLDSTDHSSVYRINCALCCNCSGEVGLDWQFSSPSTIVSGDILFGRGRKNSTHPGNKIFNRIIELHQDRYSVVASRDEKTQISHEVVDQLRVRGRFLKECDKHSGCWVEADNDAARVKVAQALQYRRRSCSKSLVKEAINMGPTAPTGPLRTSSLPLTSTPCFAALLNKGQLKTSKSLNLSKHSETACEREDSSVDLFDFQSDSEDEFFGDLCKTCPPPPPLRLVDSLTILEPSLLEPLPFSGEDPLDRVPSAELLALLSTLSRLLQDPQEYGFKNPKKLLV